MASKPLKMAPTRRSGKFPPREWRELADKISTAVAILQWELGNMWGHVSARTPDGRHFLLRHLRPPSNRDIPADDVLVYDLKGNLISGRRDQPDEIFFYLCPYQARPDIGAVVHCHPAMVLALAAVGRKIVPFHQRMAKFGSEVPVLPWLYGYWRKHGEMVARVLKKNRSVIIRGHGAVVVGETIEEACMNMVELERSAKVILLASALGDIKALPPAVLKKFQTVVGSRWKDDTDQAKSRSLVEWMEWHYYESLVKRGERWSRL